MTYFGGIEEKRGASVTGATMSECIEKVEARFRDSFQDHTMVVMDREGLTVARKRVGDTQWRTIDDIIDAAN
jgi:hypothetical protein